MVALGGSITCGVESTSTEQQWEVRVFRWLNSTYPNARSTFRYALTCASRVPCLLHPMCCSSRADQWCNIACWGTAQELLPGSYPIDDRFSLPPDTRAGRCGSGAGGGGACAGHDPARDACMQPAPLQLGQALTCVGPCAAQYTLNDAQPMDLMRSRDLGPTPPINMDTDMMRCAVIHHAHLLAAEPARAPQKTRAGA